MYISPSTSRKRWISGFWPRRQAAALHLEEQNPRTIAADHTLTVISSVRGWKQAIRPWRVAMPQPVGAAEHTSTSAARAPPAGLSRVPSQEPRTAHGVCPEGCRQDSPRPRKSVSAQKDSALLKRKSGGSPWDPANSPGVSAGPPPSRGFGDVGVGREGSGWQPSRGAEGPEESEEKKREERRENEKEGELDLLPGLSSQDQTQLGSGEWKPRPVSGGPAGRGGGQQRRTFARGLWAWRKD